MHKFVPIILFALMSTGAATTAPAATRNYDCAKAGNANKATCKGAAPAAKATAKAEKTVARKAANAAVAAPASKGATHVATTTTTKTMTTRSYDCTKAGNKNKAQCRSAAITAAKPVAKQATTTTTTRNYDCAKAGNANKAQCKTSAARITMVGKPVATPRPIARPAAAPARRPAGAAVSSENRNAVGAIAQCKDGLYSHAAHRDGACARHGGVAHWS